MRHADGRSGFFGWWVALCALGACSGVPHPSANAPVTAPACALREAASRDADTAAIVFRVAEPGALSARRDACALRLTAEWLRPWAHASNDRWTVAVLLDDTGATVRRLGDESARDAIDAGTVLIATEDLDLVAYAAARPGLEVTPLPWDRTYFRLTPGAVAPLARSVSSDAVRVDARPPGVPCDTVAGATAPESMRALSARVVYELGDRTARELAERVVALAEGSTVSAVGLAATDLDAALRAGNELAYIVSVPQAGDAACRALLDLAQRAPWITPRAITPLVETRAYAIVPRPPHP